jgi:enoyl-CoA hydratase
MAESFDFAENLSKKAPVSIQLLKKMLHGTRSKAIDGILQEETDAILQCMKTDDWHEGLVAFNEKRSPSFKGE